MDAIHTTINKELCNEIFKSKKILAIVGIIVGAISSIITFIINVLNEFNMLLLFVALYFIFSFMWLLGISILMTIRKNTKEFDNKTIESDATFYDDYVNIISFNGDVQIEDVKHFYKDALYFKEVKNYVLLYINRVLAVPFTKQECLVEFFIEKGIKKR